MAKHKVTQVNGSTGRERRSVEVDESKVTSARNWMNGRASKLPAESSDWVKVEKR